MSRLVMPVMLSATWTIAAAAAEPNYDEAAVPAYVLPELLAGPDGQRVTSAADWEATARPHQLQLLEENVYGQRLPAVVVSVEGKLERTATEFPGGVPAERIQARLRLGVGEDAPTTDVLLYLPKSSHPVPVFLKLNFNGNQAETTDSAVPLCTAWLPANDKKGIVANRATAASRGTAIHRWPVAEMIGRGFGMATACYGDVFPDRPDGRAASALVSLGRPPAGDLAADEPAAIATWAWQLSRILDWLITLPEVDPAKVIVVGHSRNGKAAVWAGACDRRFAMVVSNESGCGGAALSRRRFGETVEAITRRFPHWFCPAFAGYADRENDLPTDQHAVLAMVAPRPLYVASAVDDRWADPRGEFLGAVAAGPVWELFGKPGLGTTDYPAVGQVVGDTIGYHVRPGKHDLLVEDWRRFADFADRHFFSREQAEESVSGESGGDRQ